MRAPPAVTSQGIVGLGVQQPFTPANPGAGNLLTYSVPGLYAVRFTSLVFTVTAANAGSSRLITVEYRGKDNLPFAISEPTALVVVNTAERFVASPAYTFTDVQAGSDCCFPLSQVLLFPGDVMVVNITTLDTGDAITNVRGVVEQFRYDPTWLPQPEPE